MPPKLVKVERLTASARLQREIDSGNTSEEPRPNPEQFVDIDLRTPIEKIRLLNWALAYTPIPWDDKTTAYWPEEPVEEKKFVRDEASQGKPSKSLATSEPPAESLVASELPLRPVTPLALPLPLDDTPSISHSFGQIILQLEPSLSPKKQKVTSKKAKMLAASELSFDILAHDKRLQGVPRKAILAPPSMSYGLGSELEQLVHDWEFGQTLVINECPIPLMYWRDIYKEYFPNWWVAIKTDWSKWRVG
jgi:hypothetical protein